MRWMFPDPDDRTETAVRKRIVARIDDWWERFEPRQALSELFKGKKKWDLPVDGRDAPGHRPTLIWGSARPSRLEGHRLSSRRKAGSTCGRWSAPSRSPPKLPGWEFYSYRLAEDLEQAGPTVEGAPRHARRRDRFDLRSARQPHRLAVPVAEDPR